MELTGCGPKEAADALVKHKEIWLAVDALLTKPAVKGDAYLPPKPVVQTGLDPDQAARCARGRWLQDQVNAVFSVAHSQSRPETGAVVPEPPQQQDVVLPTSAPSASSVPSSSPQDAAGKTTQ